MPATPGQVRFWSLDQLNPGNPALNMPLMWQCTGPLDVQALTSAFTHCLARHEMLRTTFALREGRLMQIIEPAAPVSIPVVDLEAQEPQAQRQRADELTRGHAAFRFDLELGPLLVLKLLRFDAEHHTLLVTMHHIICDGISLGILMRDMVTFYQAETDHAEAELPELPIQFADFAVWQEQWLQSDEPARSLDFWRESLGNDFPRLNLTRDADALAALPEQNTSGDIETLQIPQALQAQANAFCKRENVTLNILLFSIFAALLRRLTGQLDLVIGSPCANRTEDTQELIGLFMNIQVMRLRLAEDETFRSLLRRVQDWTLGAYENQELPFESLVHDPYFADGSASLEIPIFFLYQKSFMQTYRMGGVEIVPLRSESPGAVFEMFFAIVDRLEDGPRLQLEYNPRYFKASTIQRYLRLYVNLLESALTAPEARVDKLTLLKRNDRTEVLTTWNQTHVDFPAFEPVCQSFLRRARQSPDKIALECNGITWTNAHLATYAQRLAARLLAEGLQPEGLVAICVRRCPEMVGSVLAVMIAGGAYVPMDPRHPVARLETILADSAASFLLIAPELQLHTSARILNPFAEQPAVTPGPAHITPASLAYVIYTSGSTGQPKGVAIEHGALVNLLRSMQQTPGLTADDVLVAITTLAFDIAALELLLPLITGAKLVIATTAEVQDGRQLLALLERTRATVLQATPGAWRILIDAGWSAPKNTALQPLRALCGGEALPRDLANRMLARAGEVWNLYGPTETTIWSTATRVHAGTGALPIGPPVANTQLYVLDPHLAPPPIGVIGELFIAGAGLARGYWNRPELTAGKFVPNPFTGGRMYATGDLARWLDDGSLQLLGRADFQVKVRGYRIELDEIESAIRTHPRVVDAIVTHSKSDTTGTTRLTAYLAAGEQTEAQSNQLIAQVRDTLERTLPEFMLPNAFVTLPALPLNTNGKVDRHALPSPTTSYLESGTRSTAAESDHYTPPSDVIESQLADIWQTTLGLPRISVRASFFSLGVGSLAALRLITKMNRVYAMDLGLASLISASTIESIAELIRERFAPNVSSSVVPLQPRGDRRPLYIVHGVGGNIVNFYGLAMRMGTDIPIYGIQSQALVARQPALLHLKDMAAHYIADIRKVQPHGPYDLLGYSFGGTVVLEMAHQLRSAGEEVTMLGMIDSKSKDYELELTRLKPMGDRVSKRMNRFRGNTGNLAWAERIKYIADKINTRAIRFACMAAARLHMKQVPAFMRSAYDINYVAVQNYKPRPYAGRLTLFRASEQDDSRGPYDLGWSAIFSGGVDVHDLTGDHERIFLEPNIDLLARSLRETLSKV
jgi:amino acid adenylation domain-containing protein